MTVIDILSTINIKDRIIDRFFMKKIEMLL